MIDQSARKHDVAGVFGFRFRGQSHVGGAQCPRVQQQRPQAAATDVTERLSHGGQRWSEIAGFRDVVEAHHADVIRNHPAQSAQRPHGADRGQVVVDQHPVIDVLKPGAGLTDDVRDDIVWRNCAHLYGLEPVV